MNKQKLGPALFHTEEGTHQAAIVVKVIDETTANLFVIDEEGTPGRQLAAKFDCSDGHYHCGDKPEPASKEPPPPKEEPEEEPHKRTHHRKH